MERVVSCPHNACGARAKLRLYLTKVARKRISPPDRNDHDFSPHTARRMFAKVYIHRMEIPDIYPCKPWRRHDRVWVGGFFTGTLLRYTLANVF